MDLHHDLIKWFREMGYSGNIPENLFSICNNSTRHIWEQLMQNAQPKHQVKTIRSNIILDRLKLKPLNAQGNFSNGIKEIELYKEKLTLERKRNILKEAVQNKKYRVDELSQICRLKELSADVLRQKINQYEQRQFLLEAKQDQLQLQVTHAEEMLVKLQNVTPIEREDSSTVEEITDVLLNCAAKLDELLLENQKLKQEQLHKPLECTSSRKKAPSNADNFVTSFLLIQEKGNFEEITRSCRKSIQHKPRVVSDDAVKNVKNRLFSTPKIIIEDIETQYFKQSGIQLLSCSDEGTPNSEMSGSLGKPNKRESLGLLPDFYLDQVIDNESFLQVTGKPAFDLSNNSVQSLDNEVFISSIDTTRSTFKAPYNLPKKPLSRPREDLKVKMYHNSIVNKNLEDLLHKNNREIVKEALQNRIAKLLTEFTKLTVAESEVIVNGSLKITDSDLAKLRFVHVEMQFKILRQKQLIKKLIAKICEKKVHLLNAIQSLPNRFDLEEYLEAHLKRVSLDASLAAIKKEIGSTNVIESDSNDIQLLDSQIVKIKESITNKLELIQWTMDEMYDILKVISSNRESVRNQIWQLRALNINTEWMNSLLEDTCYQELKVFENFPLDYQCKGIHREVPIFYDALTSECSTQKLHIGMILQIVESPFTPPETVLINILRSKFLMEKFKMFRNKQLKIALFVKMFKKYSFDDLKRQEGYIDFAVDRLNSLMLSPHASKTVSMGEVVKQSMDTWVELSKTNFISRKRMLSGHDFQYYKNKLNSYM